LIRQATTADSYEIVRMTTRFLLSTEYGAMFSADVTPETIGNLIATVLKHGTIFLAELWPEGGGEKQVIGMLAIVVIPHPLTGRTFADEIAWWVDPEHRNGLTGPYLLRSAEDWARQNGANMVKMVAPAGSTVGAFYERRGYRAVETAYLKGFE